MSRRPTIHDSPLELLPSRESAPPSEPLVVHVETVPTDVATTTAHRAPGAARATRRRVLSSNPRLCRIVALGTAVSGKAAVCHLARTVTDEKLMLDEFWHRVEATEGCVVTWNGGYGLRMILLRSLVLRVPLTIDARQIADWFERGRYSPHFDCLSVLTNCDDSLVGEGLEEWATFLGLPSETHPDEADVCAMVQRRQWDILGAHVRHAVTTVDGVYRKARSYFPSILGGR